MKPFEILLYAILRLQAAPNPDWGETQDQYVDRLTVVAQSIAHEAPTQHWQSAVATVWFFESNFAPKIHGKVGTGDNGKANCMGQIHRLWGQPKEEWAALAGTDEAATRRCAAATYRFLRGALYLCRKRDSLADMREAFSLYGTGSSCTSMRSATKRARKFGLVRSWMMYPKPLPPR